MKNFTLLSATALLLAACAMETPQISGVSPSPSLNISNGTGSFVGKKVNEFTREYNNIRNTVNNHALELVKTNQSIKKADDSYNAIIKMIENRLQAGTTPSNPELVASLAEAQSNLEILESGTQKLAAISSNVIAEQEKLTALSSTVNATYGLPGAYDLDHSHLNEIVAAISQQEITNADIIAAVKTNISSQQQKAEQFRAEITRLNVDVAAGYAKTDVISFPQMEVLNLQPVSVETVPAKEKSVRSDKKIVKLAKNFGVIEEPAENKVAKKTAAKPVSAPKNASKPKSSTSHATVNAPVKTEDKTLVKTEKTAPAAAQAPKADSAVADKKEDIAPKTNTNGKKAGVISKTVAFPKGTIFAVDFPTDDVEYYPTLLRAVQNTMVENPDTKLEVVAIMPMDTAAQERIQNLTAKIFGELLTLSVPAENLSVSARSEIDRKVPSILIIKR